MCTFVCISLVRAIFCPVRLYYIRSCAFSCHSPKFHLFTCILPHLPVFSPFTWVPHHSLPLCPFTCILPHSSILSPFHLGSTPFTSIPPSHLHSAPFAHILHHSLPFCSITRIQSHSIGLHHSLIFRPVHVCATPFTSIHLSLVHQ